MISIFSAKVLKKLIKLYIPVVYVVLLSSTFDTQAQYAENSEWEKKTGYYVVRGLVIDSITGESLPYSSVKPDGATGGAVADGRGIFEFRVPVSTKAIEATMIGYDSKYVPLKQSSHNMYVIGLSPSKTGLKELVVKRRKYSKKNNPAVDFVRRIKEMSSCTDPRRNDYYSYRKYERMTLALNNFEHGDSDAVMRRMPFLKEHIDTSEISGKPVLPVSVHETVSRNLFRKEPLSEKTLVEGRSSAGVDDMVDKASMQTFMEDVLRGIDLYDRDINILQNRFVSPLSPIGPDFYRYYLTDTIEVENEPCVVLSFYPRNKASFGFTGHIYVPAADSSMFIKRVDMRVPKDINLNFVDNMLISQTFDKAEDGSRLKTEDDLVLELSIIPGTQSIYVRRRALYDLHSFNAPEDSSVFGIHGKTIEADSAGLRSENWWNESRKSAPVADGEGRIELLLQRLRKVPIYYWGEKAVRTMVVGYVPTGNPNKFDIGPLNTFASYNSIEGLRLRAGGLTTANLSRRWFARAMAAYGFRDCKWKYGVELEYSFVDKKYHSREFPVHALRFTTDYDLDFPGQHYKFTNSDNMFLSLKRISDNMAVYKRMNRLEYILELRNNFSLKTSIAHERRDATRSLPFIDGYGRKYGHYTQSSFEIQLRYAPGEKFYQTTSQRIPINLDAPVFMVSHTTSLKGVLGSMFTINKTELNFMKRFWLSAFGYIDAMVGAGHVWNAAPYINMLMPNANLSYTIQPESFALLNPMEFVNDSQFNWELTYWANGAILNYVPFVKKLKLREVFSFKGVWGHLSGKNNPVSNPELFRFSPGATTRPMDKGPYMEVSAGIDNLLKCLRMEYVWRLNYRDVHYNIDRSGVRLSFHMTF